MLSFTGFCSTFVGARALRVLGCRRLLAFKILQGSAAHSLGSIRGLLKSSKKSLSDSCFLPGMSIHREVPDIQVLVLC